MGHEDVVFLFDVLSVLRDDIAERYHSVWVDPSNHLFYPELGHHPSNDYLKEL